MARALEAMRELAESTPDGAHVASVCGFACNVAALAGRWDDLEDFVQMGLAADPSSQFAFWGGHLLMSGAIAAVHRGDVDAGTASFTEARLATSTRAERRHWRRTTHCWPWRVPSTAASTWRLRRCSLPHAELDTRHERWTESIVLSAEAVVAHAAGDAETARDRLATAVSVATEQGAHGLLLRVREIASGIAVSLDA